MQKDQIKKGLAEKGYDFRMLAEVIGKSPSLVSKVASRQARSRVVAQAIAKALGMRLDEVFPDVPAYQHLTASDPDERAAKQAELKRLLQADDSSPNK
jgi:ribosome-binding protein aMBF1 (putative translation factor)